jgi:hypothetical protein
MGVEACHCEPEVLVVNAKPRLSPWSRLQLVQRVLAGRPAAHVAAEMGVSRATAYKWLARYLAEGASRLLDRSSRPCRSPTRTDPVVEAAIVALRRDRRLGPARIGGILGLNASTVHRVAGPAPGRPLAWLDRPTGQVVRRYAPSTTTPGWPTPRSIPTRRARPAPGSSPGPQPGSPAHGITRIERVMTDNAFAYRRSAAWRQALAGLDADARFTRPYRP